MNCTYSIINISIVATTFVYQVRELERERSISLETVTMQSENNLNRNPEMEQTKIQLRKIVDECTEIRQSIREKESIILRKIVPRKLEVEDDIEAALLASAAEAEENSENIAKSFLCGELSSYETFLDMFLKKRKLAHLRRVRADRYLERHNKQ